MSGTWVISPTRWVMLFAFLRGKFNLERLNVLHHLIKVNWPWPICCSPARMLSFVKIVVFSQTLTRFNMCIKWREIYEAEISTEKHFLIIEIYGHNSLLLCSKFHSWKWKLFFFSLSLSPSLDYVSLIWETW